MIVKNESHIIIKTLQNICSHIKFNYWVISDTGSTDDTPTLIQDFFKEQHIQGELHHDEWKDFGHNRTLALQYAYQKTDYVFIFDADDSIEGNLILPPLTENGYSFIFGTSFSYQRTLLVKNNKKWWFTGVLHEYIDSDDTTSTVITGKYHIIASGTGSRSLNPNKYKEDAITLENAFHKETNLALQTRYSYYCGQSYRDANDYANSILWFKKCTEMNGWKQEKYCAALEIGLLYYKLNQFEQSQYWLCKTIQYDDERIEGVVIACEQLYKINNHTLINALYHKYKNYNHSLKNKLFIHNSYYDYYLEYYNSISAYYVNDFTSGYECCQLVIQHCTDLNKVNLTTENIKFYKE